MLNLCPSHYGLYVLLKSTDAKAEYIEKYAGKAECAECFGIYMAKRLSNQRQPENDTDTPDVAWYDTHDDSIQPGDVVEFGRSRYVVRARGFSAALGVVEQVYRPTQTMARHVLVRHRGSANVKVQGLTP